MSISLAVSVCLVSLLPLPECQAAEPTLARLSFWVPPERVGEFEAAYRKQVIPILVAHGLDTTASRTWKGAEGVFSRLFDVASIADVAKVQMTLEQDTTWARTLGELGTDSGARDVARQIPYRFGLFSTPAGPGKLSEVQADTQRAGPGKGPWRSYYVTDGLANN
ncbi:MAG: hypothetical protein QGI83_13855, partial [Candidatus Latescibacteria bacterium]|nr:hypothetical protein [Candidatus Latescibacterota bacterium]